jgi:TonB family protein
MSKTRRAAALTAVLVMLPLADFWASSTFPMHLHAAEAPVHKVGPGVQAPRLIDKVEPQYTDEARDAKLEGSVILTIEVHPDGRAYNVQVQRSLGMGLDEQAVAAIEQWTFAPGVKDSKPVIVAATVEVNFKLMDDPEPAPPARP